MWRDRWLTLGVAGALLTCLACFTPLAVVALGAIGLGAWTGRLDLALLPLLVAFVALAAYRYRACRGRTPWGWRARRWVLGVATGFALYVRERRRCARLACRMAGSRLTLALLILAALVVSAAIALDRLPELTSDLIAWASGDAPMSFDPALVSVEQLIEAVRKAGFQPSLKRPAQ